MDRRSFFARAVAALAGIVVAPAVKIFGQTPAELPGWNHWATVFDGRRAVSYLNGRKTNVAPPCDPSSYGKPFTQSYWFKRYKVGQLTGLAFHGRLSPAEIAQLAKG